MYKVSPQRVKREKARKKTEKCRVTSFAVAGEEARRRACVAKAASRSRKTNSTKHETAEKQDRSDVIVGWRRAVRNRRGYAFFLVVDERRHGRGRA